MANHDQRLVTEEEFIEHFRKRFENRNIKFPNRHYKTWQDFFDTKFKKHLSEADLDNVGILSSHIAEKLSNINKTASMELYSKLPDQLYKNKGLDKNREEFFDLINNYSKQESTQVPKAKGKGKVMSGAKNVSDQMDSIENQPSSSVDQSTKNTNGNTITIDIFEKESRRFHADDFFKNDKRRFDLHLENLDALGIINNHKWSQTININANKFNKVIGKDPNPDSIDGHKKSKTSEYIFKIIDPEFRWLAIIEHALKRGEYVEPRFGYRMACESFLRELLAYKSIEEYKKSCTDEEQLINIPKIVNLGIINMKNPTHRANENELPYYANGSSNMPNHAFYILLEKLPITDTITQKHIKSLRKQIYNLNYLVNIQHNDIRGDNIIISGDKAYLIDFGESSKFDFTAKGKPIDEKIIKEYSYDLEMLEENVIDEIINENIGN
ncbi:hypothetical protein BN7_5403 [Wickerhamomyces ciferrii]|uniref:Protein kinase domain-containing protein n=1 Tax=Wickerhamomyces ciferrii (strain ATCC 14091 / BCRC 22168 / CBS 111 / JCM 3599 / NBRC 0793 / NRRL Y-1031 F-60-10) TaxID=1206466 RepID=K0KV95_WICCF|nr:uncharacterized protein BN7_5403 [Wickerhamomyces ciferrii]CCH45817.1 hypothetical protein BN7_5403 [Wickerhamomyces ciferrii]